MNPTETMALLRLITGYHPGFAMNDQTPAAWHHALGDIPAADATAAVHAHYATGGPWIMPADVRRRVVASRGLLPPDVETAYAQAREMNRWLDRRVGPEPTTHPAVYATMSKHKGGIGWEILDGPEGYAHKRFAEAYTLVSARDAERALTTPLPELESAIRAPKALPAGSGVEAARREQPVIGPIDREGLAKVRAMLARSGFGKPVPTADAAR